LNLISPILFIVQQRMRTMLLVCWHYPFLLLTESLLPQEHIPTSVKFGHESKEVPVEVQYEQIRADVIPLETGNKQVTGNLDSALPLGPYEMIFLSGSDQDNVVVSKPTEIVRPSTATAVSERAKEAIEAPKSTPQTNEQTRRSAPLEPTECESLRLGTKPTTPGTKTPIDTNKLTDKVSPVVFDEYEPLQVSQVTVVGLPTGSSQTDDEHN